MCWAVRFPNHTITERWISEIDTSETGRTIDSRFLCNEAPISYDATIPAEETVERLVEEYKAKLLSNINALNYSH